MSGIVSAMADAGVLGQMMLVWQGLVSVAAFVAGAMTSTVLIRHGYYRHSRYAGALLVEALLIAVFAIGQDTLSLRMAVWLLCFTMGLQNALITKLSRAEIRTTHVTGMITDIGIELGRKLYAPRSFRPSHGFTKLRLLLSLVGLFALGGVTGAWGFHHFGFLAAWPLAILLLGLTITPIMDDIRRRRRRRQYRLSGQKE
jgi:uncharacterized membrane protein YoaK (UPF0700 family)